MSNHVSVHLEMVLVSVQDRFMVCAKRTIGSENHFGCTRWDSEVTWVMWDLTCFSLETVLGSVQDMSTVCAKRTIGSETIIYTPDGTPR